MRSFGYFCILFSPKNILLFFRHIKGYQNFCQQQLYWKSFSTCLIALDSLWEVFWCSRKTDCMSTMFGFSKVFGYWVIIFDRFTNFFFSFQKRLIVFCGITRIRWFLLIWLQRIVNFFSSDVSLNNNGFSLVDRISL